MDGVFKAIDRERFWLVEPIVIVLMQAVDILLQLGLQLIHCKAHWQLHLHILHMYELAVLASDALNFCACPIPS